MGQDYSRRYGKEDQQRRGRKFHSPFSSYSSNPNPFPPQNVQGPSGASKAPMFSSRRQETGSAEYSPSSSWYARRGPGGYRNRPVESQQPSPQQQQPNRMRHSNTSFNKYTPGGGTGITSDYSNSMAAGPNGAPSGNSQRPNIRHNNAYDYSARRPVSNSRYHAPRHTPSGGAYDNMPRFPSTPRNGGDRDGRYSMNSYSSSSTHPESEFYESRAGSMNKQDSVNSRGDSSDTPTANGSNRKNVVQTVDSEPKVTVVPPALPKLQENSISNSEPAAAVKLDVPNVSAEVSVSPEPVVYSAPSDDKVAQQANEDVSMDVDSDSTIIPVVKKESLEVKNDQLVEKYKASNTNTDEVHEENVPNVAANDNEQDSDEMNEMDSVDIESNEQVSDKEMVVPNETKKVFHNKVHTEQQILPIKTETIIDYSSVSGCIFPMRNAELLAWEFKHKPLVNKDAWLKHLNKNIINDFAQYSFLESELLIFKQADAFKLQKFFSLNLKEVEKRQSDLTEEWVYRSKLWNADVKFYDRQLSQFYQDSDEKKNDDEEKEVQKPKSSRRNRHGDSVRTEAEFMEILKTLEQERERDPLVRAQYGAATIPNMILDPLEKFEFETFMDCNNLETDKEKWAHRLITDPIDNFTADEHEKFSRAYLMYPKRFGKISQNMGGIRTHEECVLHYYRTKKEANYKQLLINKNKRAKKSKSLNSKKPGKKPEKGGERRNPTDTPELEPSGTPIEDISGEFILGSRKRKPGITVPVKKPSISESATDDQSMTESNSQQILDEPILPIKNEINESVAIAMAAQNIEAVDDSPIVKDEISTTTKATSSKPAIGTPIDDRKRKKRRTEEGHSSYWSVHETNNFPQLLQEFGSDWDSIARVLKTKTAAMTRNYYQRSLNDHPEWRIILLNTDANKKNSVSNESDNTQQHHLPMNQVSQNSSIIDQGVHNPLESSQILPPIQQSLAGPPVGFFYKKPESYTSAVPKPVINELPPKPVLNETPVQQVATGNAENTNNRQPLVEYSFQSSGQSALPDQIYPIQDTQQNSAAITVTKKFNESDNTLTPNQIRTTHNDNPTLPAINNTHLIAKRPDYFPDIIPKPPVRSSIRSLLNSDDATTNNEHASGLASLAALAPPPVLSSGKPLINSLLNATSITPNVAHNVGINGLAAVAGFYADTSAAASITPNSKNVGAQVGLASSADNNNNNNNNNNNQSNMSALNALAKVAFEQN